MFALCLLSADLGVRGCRVQLGLYFTVAPCRSRGGITLHRVQRAI